MVKYFWQEKSLADMSPQEWESLCDGCGKCCLVKLQDEEDDQVYYTDIACRYLDLSTARCSDYTNRLRNVPACLNLTPANLADCYWLPESCAYRRIDEGRGLPQWHPLIAGRQDATRTEGRSVAGRVVSEDTVDEDDWQDRVIYWVEEQ